MSMSLGNESPDDIMLVSKELIVLKSLKVGPIRRATQSARAKRTLYVISTVMLKEECPR